MIEYKVLKEISQNPTHTQRTLAHKLDISLGKANYVLSGLIEKGIIKARKLTNTPKSIRWNYILTRKGMEEKVRITQRFLRQRMDEFEVMRREIEELKEEVGDSSLLTKKDA